MNRLRNALALAATTLAFSLPAQAASVDINMTGWESYAEWNGPGMTLNTSHFVNIGAGARVDGFEYIGLSFETYNGSWLREFTLSVSDAVNFESLYLDWRPSNASSGGTFGPGSGAWGGPTGGAGGFGAGGAFLVTDGRLWLSVYESFDDPFFEDFPEDWVDAIVTGGILRIHYTPADTGGQVPEPSTYGLAALGLLGLLVSARRRRRR